MSKANKYEDFDDELEYELEEEEAQGSKIDWTSVFRKLYARKKLFIISFFATIIIGYPLLLTRPKVYSVEVKLAPEFSAMNNTSSVGNLSSLMKSFGISTGSNNNGDAILPNLYPDLMNSTSFMVSLFNVPIETKDGEVKTTYYEYLKNHQKTPVWTQLTGWITSLLPKDTTADSKENANNKNRPNALTKSQTAIAGAIASKVICDVDNKTGVITINVKDQDPLVCATIADSTCLRLQEFITEYRVKKARIELDNVQKQYDQAKEDYEAAKSLVEDFNNSNWDLIDEDLIVQKQALANDMQLKFTTMSAFNSQLMNARSKYESMRPVFTVLDGATVPIKPSGPSRMKSLFLLLFLVLGGEMAWVLFKNNVKEKIASIKEPEQA